VVASAAASGVVVAVGVVVVVIKLDNLPMPSSSNHRLIPSRGRLIKSNEARLYDREIQIWSLRNKNKLVSYKIELRELIQKGFMLKVSVILNWEKSKLLTKKGEPKKNDLDNRLKSCLDAVSKLVEIDDKYIIEISAIKKFWDKNYSSVDVTIEKASWDE